MCAAFIAVSSIDLIAARGWLCYRIQTRKHTLSTLLLRSYSQTRNTKHASTRIPSPHFRRSSINNPERCAPPIVVIRESGLTIIELELELERSLPHIPLWLNCSYNKGYNAHFSFRMWETAIFLHLIWYLTSPSRFSTVISYMSRDLRRFAYVWGRYWLKMAWNGVLGPTQEQGWCDIDPQLTRSYFWGVYFFANFGENRLRNATVKVHTDA